MVVLDGSIVVLSQLFSKICHLLQIRAAENSLLNPLCKPPDKSA